MEVPSEVLQKLVCERCSGYLSRGPVHLVENTKYRCGRCPLAKGDEENGIRMEAYEELAKLMSFPCRYQENGCASKVPFTDNERHEQTCPYREYLCPIAESDQCEWTGLQTGVQEHCQQDHPTKVVQNPCKLKYNIKQPSLNNYILFAFEVIFLIRSKVCTAKRKIYHEVRLIGDPTLASNFKYTLDIRNNDKVFSIPGDVFPRDLQVLQKGTTVVTGFKKLVNMLGDLKDTTFTLTIESSGSNTLPVKTLDVKVKCSECWTVTEPMYRGDWMCKKHAPEQYTCTYCTKGCTYSDMYAKRVKHETYYCQYSAECFMCPEYITGTTLDSHYTQVHGDITHRAGTVFTVRPITGIKELLIECDFGTAVCEYILGTSHFVLEVYTPLSNAQLYMYRCTVELSHPDTGHTLTRTPAVQYDWRQDWYIQVPLSVYNAYAPYCEVNIKFNINKINDPSQLIV